MYYRMMPDTIIVETGRPRVIMIMGLGGSHQYWIPQAEHLAKFCDVCIFDNRGIGYSGSPPSEWRWTTGRMAGDALQVLNHIGWQERVHVIGISMGGMIAQELALSAPERVASLTLVSTIASALHALPSVQAMVDLLKSTQLWPVNKQERALAGMRLMFPEPWLKGSRASELHAGETVSNERWVRKFTLLLGMEVPSEFADKGREVPGQAPASTTLMQISAVLTHRVTHERCESLRRLGVPLVVITGDSDVLVRPANSDALSSLLEVPVKVLPGLGHGLTQQDAPQVNVVLEEVVREGERRLLADSKSRL